MALTIDPLLRAGIVPFIFDEKKDDFIYMFMMPSNAKYGGAFLQIAKGGIEKNEELLESAIREGEEELGLKRSNLKGRPFELGRYLQTNLKESYHMHVFASEIKAKKDFGKWHFETQFATWITNDRFQEIGRPSQKLIITELQNHLVTNFDV
jgi:8-oxo-dGTP pyrophosphatase MutT (NUDIX family)